VLVSHDILFSVGVSGQDARVPGTRAGATGAQERSPAFSWQQRSKRSQKVFLRLHKKVLDPFLAKPYF
jgi:hypothetical protein